MAAEETCAIKRHDTDPNKGGILRPDNSSVVENKPTEVKYNPEDGLDTAVHHSRKQILSQGGG